MRIADAESVLRAALEPLGLGSPAMSMLEAWEGFCRFAHVPVVDAASDGILFQAGNYGFSGQTLYTVGLVRQFEHVDEDGEHVAYEQLQCELTFEPQSVESWNTWFFPGDDWEGFVARVENHVTFELACSAEGVGTELWQERV